MNRKWMPKADFSAWTPLKFIAEMLFKWTFPDKNGSEKRPASGALLKLVTKNGETEIVPID